MSANEQGTHDTSMLCGDYSNWQSDAGRCILSPPAAEYSDVQRDADRFVLSPAGYSNAQRNADRLVLSSMLNIPVNI